MIITAWHSAYSNYFKVDTGPISVLKLHSTKGIGYASVQTLHCILYHSLTHSPEM